MLVAVVAGAALRLDAGVRLQTRLDVGAAPRMMIAADHRLGDVGARRLEAEAVIVHHRDVTVR